MSESEPGTVRRRLIEASERVNPIQPVHLWRTPVSATVDLLIVTHVSV